MLCLVPKRLLTPPLGRDYPSRESQIDWLAKGMANLGFSAERCNKMLWARGWLYHRWIASDLIPKTAWLAWEILDARSPQNVWVNAEDGGGSML